MIGLSSWLEVKRQLVELTALDRDALHIYFAVLIQSVTVWLTRWRYSDIMALIPLVALECLNEFADLRYEVWPPADRGLQWSASVHDVINTLVIPVAIMLVVRRHDARAARLAGVRGESQDHDHGGGEQG